MFLNIHGHEVRALVEVNCLRLGVVPQVPVGGPHGDLSGHVAAQSAAHDLGQDPVHQEDDHRATQDHPPQAQQDEGEHEEGFVTVRIRVSILKLDLKLPKFTMRVYLSMYIRAL